MTSICCCFWYSIPLLLRNHQAIDGTTLCVFHDFHGTLISALYTFKWLLWLVWGSNPNILLMVQKSHSQPPGILYIQTFLNNRDVSYQPQHGEWSFPDFWTAIKQVISFVSPWPSRFWRSFDAGGRGVSVFHHCVKFGRLLKAEKLLVVQNVSPFEKKTCVVLPHQKNKGKENIKNKQ